MLRHGQMASPGSGVAVNDRPTKYRIHRWNVGEPRESSAWDECYGSDAEAEAAAIRFCGGHDYGFMEKSPGDWRTPAFVIWSLPPKNPY